MTYYHCSPNAGLKTLEPRQPENFHKPARVYMTTLLPMALMYGIRNFEYTYGYTKTGEIFLEEYFPGALELYKGKHASLYICAPSEVVRTRIPNEVVSEASVPVISEIQIVDVYEALVEQERLGNLTIRRYEELSQSARNWIHDTVTDLIRKEGLLKEKCAKADYYRTHYPSCWEAAKKKPSPGGEGGRPKGLTDEV